MKTADFTNVIEWLEELKTARGNVGYTYLVPCEGMDKLLDELRTLRDLVEQDGEEHRDVAGAIARDAALVTRQRALDVLRSLRPDATVSAQYETGMDPFGAFAAGFAHAREKAAAIIEKGAEAWEPARPHLRVREPIADGALVICEHHDGRRSVHPANVTCEVCRWNVPAPQSSTPTASAP